MGVRIDNLVWFQQHMDYYIELGGKVDELRTLAKDRIWMVQSKIRASEDYDTITGVWLPEITRIYSALKQLKDFETAEGPQPSGDIDKEWLIMQWGLFLDYHSFDYDEDRWDEIGPFLEAMHKKYDGTVHGNEMEDFVEYVFGANHIEDIMREYYKDTE